MLQQQQYCITAQHARSSTSPEFILNASGITFRGLPHCFNKYTILLCAKKVFAHIYVFFLHIISTMFFVHTYDWTEQKPHQMKTCLCQP